MRTLKKLQPNVRAFLERQIVGTGNALSRFGDGQEEDGPTCNTNPCEAGIYTCLSGCSVIYQNGDFILLDGDVAGSILTYELTVSGSNDTYIFPTEVIDVSEVWIDQIPTDVWDFVPDENSLVFPEVLLDGTQILVRYL